MTPLPVWELLVVVLIGLVAGSFLSVLVTRLPASIARGDDDLLTALSTPRSSCTICTGQLPWHSLIPLIGFIRQKGKCTLCGEPIALLYPALECAAAAIAVLAWWLCAPNWMAVGIAAATGWMLLALAVIDMRTRLVPDVLVYALLWLGLAVNSTGFFVSPTQAIWGALAGYLALWIIRAIYMRRTATEGLGLGDCKLFAACGAWAGWSELSIILLSACAVSALIVLVLRTRHSPPFKIPFAPGLCIALAVVLSHALLVG